MPTCSRWKVEPSLGKGLVVGRGVAIASIVLLAACGGDSGPSADADAFDSGFGGGFGHGTGTTGTNGVPADASGPASPDDEGEGDTGSPAGETSMGDESGDTSSSNDGGDPPSPCVGGGAGPSVVVRLSRAEYARTVEALLARPIPDAGAFIPATDIQGFVGAPVMVSSASELEDYLASAERLATQALDSEWLADVDLDDRAAVARFVRTFGLRAYRRPLADDEVERLLAVYDAGTDAEDGRTGMEWLLQGMFSSPNFVYRIELGDDTRQQGDLRPLHGFERAARLSYLFTGAGPDEALLAAALAGELDDPAVLQAHARRLVAAGQAVRLPEFFSEWTGVLASDAGLVARLQRIDAANPRIAEVAAASMDAFVEHVIFANEGSFADLLTTSGIPLDRDLAAALGMPGDYGAELTFVPSDQRPGILAQPGLLAVRSSDTFAGATIRGNFVLDHIFCQKVPQPDGTEFSQFPEIRQPLATDRQTLEVLHAAAAPACAGCHNFIDPYGFAFENYDRQGRYRTHQELIPDLVAPIDASGTVITREGSYAYTDLGGFAAIVAHSQTVHTCFSRQLLQYALRRAAVDQDTCSIAQVAEQSLAGASVVDAFVETVATDSFLFITNAASAESEI